MTKPEKLQWQIDKAWEIISEIEQKLLTTRFAVGAIQSALCEIEGGDNPDEFARGQASAYDDCLTRLVQMVDGIEFLRDEALEQERCL